MENNVEERQMIFINYGKSKKGTDVYFRNDWGCYYFSLRGKCFGMMNEKLITLKGPIEENEQLRELYKDIIPGYYANKAHWNSINLSTNELTTKEIEKFIDVSYKLVYQKLTKKEQKKLDELED